MMREVVGGYFASLKTTLEEKGLANAPCQMFNCDETFLPLNIACKNVIACKNSKHVYAQSCGTTDHITLLCCASAAGILLPPMIVYSRNFRRCNYRFNGPNDALHAKSESRWIDYKLYLLWMKIFLKHCGSQHQVILFVDGHASHIMLDFINLAQENVMIPFCLPLHTTHVLQPLDVLVFKSSNVTSVKQCRLSLLQRKTSLSPNEASLGL